MVKSRASKGFLYEPLKKESPSAEERLKWLSKTIEGFVQPTLSNRIIYARLLNILWPEGHGIPGPHVSETEIRSKHDAMREKDGLKPYKDIFRRLRELQGEEGLTSIVKEGVYYQLQSLDIETKRQPRQKLPNSEWLKLKDISSNRCTHCGAQEPDIKLSPDHRVPRLRGGNNSIDNLQTLCEQCNNKKSSACQGCDLNCRVCSWAFPESYKTITITDDNKEQLRREALKLGIDQSNLANQIFRDYFLKNNQ